MEIIPRRRRNSLAKNLSQRVGKRTQEQTVTGHKSEHRQDDLSTRTILYIPADVPERKYAEKLVCDLYDRDRIREKENKK
jgi:hypothetical protein